MDIKIRNRTDEEMQLRKKELFELTDLLNQKKIFHFLWGGALLGIRRDGKLLEWDWDVEIGIFANDFKKNWLLINKLLEKNGFKIFYQDKFQLKISFVKYSEIETTSFSLIGWKYDIFTSNYIRKRLSIPKRYFQNMQLIKFENKNFFCPSPIESFLEYFYGNWKEQIKTTDKGTYLSEKNYKKNNWKLYLYLERIFNIFSLK